MVISIELSKEEIESILIDYAKKLGYNPFEVYFQIVNWEFESAQIKVRKEKENK